jgi:hypothetical protein
VKSWDEEHDFLLEIGLGLRPIVKGATTRLAQFDPFLDNQFSCAVLLLRVSKPTLAKCGTSYFSSDFECPGPRMDQLGEEFLGKLTEWVTISLAHWLQNDYVERCELKPCADEDRQP